MIDIAKDCLTFIWEEIILLVIQTILIKNPCKKCLVKPCCSIQCKDKHIYDGLSSFNGIAFQKFCAYLILFSFTILIVSICQIIYKYTNL